MQVGAQAEQFVLDAGADVFEIVAGEILVEVVGGDDEFGGRIGALGEQNAVLHVAVGGDEDQQDALLGQADELHVPDFRRCPARGEDDAGKVGEFGDEVRGVTDQLLRLARVKLPGHGADALVFERLHGEQ